MLIKKGTFVRIEKTILEPEDRTAKIPEETKKVPFKMWTKGVLLNDTHLLEEAEIVTMAKRQDVGKLVEVDPFYDLNYGQFLEEMIEMDVSFKNER